MAQRVHGTHTYLDEPILQAYFAYTLHRTRYTRTSMSVLGFMRVPAMRLQAARMGQAGSGWSGSPEMYDVAYG